MRTALRRRAAVELSILGVTFLTLVGGYALAKGEVSEKLALRHGAGIEQSRPHRRVAPPWLPPGLDDPRWDFSPKEETLPGDASAPGRSSTTALVIIGFAAVQIVVHMVYFLHTNTRVEGGWSMLALIFTIVLVVITLAGSLWVMFHLNTNMMPAMTHGTHTVN